jgi:hypothetical protein
MVASVRGRGRENPDFGPILPRRGYFKRVEDYTDIPNLTPHPQDDIDLHTEARSTRKKGVWTTPAQIAEDTHIQWTQNNKKVKSALENLSGDKSKPWGTFHKPSKSKTESACVTRVHFQNKRGINSKAPEADFDLWLQTMLSVESDMSFMTEPNLTKIGTRNHHRIAQDVAPRSKLIHLHPISESTTDSSKFQKGGCTSWIQPDLAARISETYLDPHSRWITTDMQGEGCVLTTINAYRTCKASDAAMSSSISAREKRSLLHANHTFALKPRKAFLHDIIQLINEKKGKGHKVLLCMDANTTWDHADIRKIKLATGLRDLMEVANPDIFPPPATYDRGDDAKGNIDIALGCDRTTEALLTAGFYGFYNINWSDHRLGELCFDSHVLLGPPIHSTTQSKRDLNLLYRLHTDKYKQRLNELHLTSKTVKRLVTIEKISTLQRTSTLEYSKPRT